MLKITKKVLKKFLEFKITRSIPGRMRLKSKAPRAIYKEAEAYDQYLKRSILLLQGIDKLEINYNIGTALIQYNIEKVHEEKILNWINKIIEVGIKNSEIIIQYGETDIEYLEEVLEEELQKELEKF